MLWLIGMLAVRIQAGPLELEVHASRTASLFHAVDQMAHWNPYGHKQYDALKEPGDEAWLQRHAALRKKLGYGAMDQALDSELGYREAMKGKLSAADAEEEAKILDHFSETLKKFLDERGPLATPEKLTASRGILEAMAMKAGRFAGVSKVSLPLWLVATPDRGGGGGASGGVVVVEVGESDPSFGLMHECWHALMWSKMKEIEAAARSIGGDPTTLSEAMAYAISPGIYRHGGGDELGHMVAAEKAKSFDDNYVRFHRVALAVRPLLEQALDDPKQTLSTFLPRALDVYVAVRELEKGRQP